MKRILFFGVCAWILSGCASEPMSMNLPPPEGLPGESPASRSENARRIDLRELKTQLGMERASDDLGFADKNFESCAMGYRGSDGTCGHRYLSVVNFRLVCRDTVGTTTRVPSSLTPLKHGRIEWRLGGERGMTGTDEMGYGQVNVVSRRPLKSDRFMLLLGSKILGLEAGEVNQIVLPGNWCPRRSYRD